MTQAPGDAHGCPACPHTSIGPAIIGSPTVNINGRPAVRVQDQGLASPCCGPNIWIAMVGSPTVFINGRAAYRLGDMGQSCGGIVKLIEGSPDVIIGGASSGGGGGGSGSPGDPATDGGTGSSSGTSASGSPQSAFTPGKDGKTKDGSPAKTPPGAKEDKKEEVKAWIEVQLVDEDGQPWKDTDYKLELPDFSMVEGKLDGSGKVRREQLLPGLARLWLPEDDRAYDVDPVPEEPANDEKAWLDVTLVDDDGKPLAGVPVKIELPDGTVVEDELDEAGRIRREDIVAGRAKIHLPEPDAVDAKRGAPVEEEPEKKAWLEVELVDDAGTPLAGQKVKIELPDGKIVEDALDDKGRLRRDDIDPGTAKIHLVEDEAGGAGAPALPAPEDEKKKAWLEVELVDDAGAPLAGQKVKIELPDGTTVEDQLDEKGRLRRDDIEPGSAKIHLVDDEAKEAAAAAAAAAQADEKEATGWLEIELRDDSGQPLAGHKVKIELPDGKVIEDKLDENGRLRREDIPAADAKLHLPEED